MARTNEHKIGHMGYSGRKLLRAQWKQWRKNGGHVNSRTDFRTFLANYY